jgi:hypothetical protein
MEKTKVETQPVPLLLKKSSNSNNERIP